MHLVTSRAKAKRCTDATMFWFPGVFLSPFCFSAWKRSPPKKENLNLLKFCFSHCMIFWKCNCLTCYVKLKDQREERFCNWQQGSEGSVLSAVQMYKEYNTTFYLRTLTVFWVGQDEEILKSLVIICSKDTWISWGAEIPFALVTSNCLVDCCWSSTASDDDNSNKRWGAVNQSSCLVNCTLDLTGKARAVESLYLIFLWIKTARGHLGYIWDGVFVVFLLAQCTYEIRNGGENYIRTLARIWLFLHKLNPTC